MPNETREAQALAEALAKVEGFVDITDANQVIEEVAKIPSVQQYKNSLKFIQGGTNMGLERMTVQLDVVAGQCYLAGVQAGLAYAKGQVSASIREKQAEIERLHAIEQQKIADAEKWGEIKGINANAVKRPEVEPEKVEKHDGATLTPEPQFHPAPGVEVPSGEKKS